MSRLYIPHAGRTYRLALVDDIDKVKHRIRAVYISELGFKDGNNNVWLRKGEQAAIDVVRTASFATSLVIEDERHANLPEHVPDSVYRIFFHCRSDWYGRSHLREFGSALPLHRDQVPEVTLMGVTRASDAVAYSILDQLPIRLNDSRSPLPAHDLRTNKAQMLDEARAIQYYYEVSH